jgi:hypothetical protein
MAILLQPERPAHAGIKARSNGPAHWPRLQTIFSICGLLFDESAILGIRDLRGNRACIFELLAIRNFA